MIQKKNLTQTAQSCTQNMRRERSVSRKTQERFGFKIELLKRKHEGDATDGNVLIRTCMTNTTSKLFQRKYKINLHALR